jgi:hypothetical protein
MKHPERVEDYLGRIAEAIERATSYLPPLKNEAELQHKKGGVAWMTRRSAGVAA